MSSRPPPPLPPSPRDPPAPPTAGSPPPPRRPPPTPPRPALLRPSGIGGRLSPRAASRILSSALSLFSAFSFHDPARLGLCSRPLKPAPTTRSPNPRAKSADPPRRECWRIMSLLVLRDTTVGHRVLSLC